MEREKKRQNKNSYVRERAAVPPEPPRAPLEGLLDEDVPAPAVREAGRLRAGAGPPARDRLAVGLLRPVQLGRLFFNLVVRAREVRCVYTVGGREVGKRPR